MAGTLLLRNDHEGIIELTLNDPGTLNALSDGMLAALQVEIDALSQDRSARVVILKGSGKVFCAGHNLREMQAKRQSRDGGAAALKELFDRCASVMTGLMRLPQPVIAQVHGIATAAGCQLVATADLAIAAEDTRFGVNGVNIGLFCSTPMVALSRNIARKQAFEMLTTGAFITATRAAELGLINRAVPPDQLEVETRALAAKINGKMAGAVRIGKRAFYDQISLPIEDAYRLTGDVMVKNMAMDATEEGIAAFLDKRAPNWPQKP
jgi:enoyl-CoA hydratase/carnithine racemase